MIQFGSAQHRVMDVLHLSIAEPKMVDFEQCAQCMTITFRVCFKPKPQHGFGGHTFGRPNHTIIGVCLKIGYPKSNA